MENSENTYNNTDFVYFEVMLSAIGVVHRKMYEVAKKIDSPSVPSLPSAPWKPKDEFDECPY